MADMSHEALMAELERLKVENSTLKKAVKSKIELSIKVSDKGAVSVYGLGRFPVTLYAQQWDRLLEKSEDIKAFIDDNKNRLSVR
jgi:hypothetical protein